MNTVPSRADEGRTRRVWDPLVRVLHWTFVAGVAAAWVTSEEGRALHEPIGYVVAAAVALRLAWGLIGPRYARFAQFVRGPGTTLAYAGAALSGRAPRYVGHNPLGGWMILALLALLAITAATGWGMTTEAFFGDEWLEELHEGAATGLLGLVLLHVAGVVWSSLQHGENLVRAMIDGRKRPPAAGDVDAA
ncbi:cytochrome b/b6 domain-containing protein [Schlegelella aquatica]|uniref:cytochrome b/b6 domain-containing protein n=1 Tax=Caldimonas aquatica TaxID=376175 RepID=UPI00375081D6